MNPAAIEALRDELAEPLPHPGADVLGRWNEQATAWLLQWFTRLGEQTIGATAGPRELADRLQEAPPEEGQDFAEVLQEFSSKIVPNAFRPNHPRFLAFIPGAPNYVSVLGDLLCAGTNFFEAVWLEAAGPTEVELVVLEWFRTWLGMPQATRGLLTSGGSEANLPAVA